MATAHGSIDDCKTIHMPSLGGVRVGGLQAPKPDQPSRTPPFRWTSVLVTGANALRSRMR